MWRVSLRVPGRFLYPEKAEAYFDRACCWLANMTPSRTDDRRLDVGWEWDVKFVECCRCKVDARCGSAATAFGIVPMCCDDCRRSMLNARARARRRVQHEPMNCAACGRSFTPKRNDAVHLQSGKSLGTSKPSSRASLAEPHPPRFVAGTKRRGAFQSRSAPSGWLRRRSREPLYHLLQRMVGSRASGSASFTSS
jgi:hypothetical protein